MTDDRDFKVHSSGISHEFITFSPDELYPEYNCLTVEIQVTDDDINEANQVFVVYINVDGYVFPYENPSEDIHPLITISRNISLVWITDNDGKYITTVNRSSTPQLIIKSPSFRFNTIIISTSVNNS